MLRIASALLYLAVGIMPSFAAPSPPMYDITRQCGAASGRNSTAMSECVVAESEARSEVLQNWSKLGEAEAQRCSGASHKAKRRPYSALAKCTMAALDGAGVKNESKPVESK